MNKAKPFLKWAGGKSLTAKDITKFFPKQFNKYFEPFLGSGAIYFTISPQKGYLNDLNVHLISVYETIRDNPHDLLVKLKIMDKEYHSLDNLDLKSKYYYEKRDIFNRGSLNVIDKSALFIFLNKAGFNGMYRENNSGDYNIPFGKRLKCLICDEDNILKVSKDLSHIKFSTVDYKIALKKAGKGDLIYLDPPYIPISSTSDFTRYHKDGFNFDEHLKLRNLALKLHKKGCFVVISNSSCPKSLELYKDKIFNVHTINVRRIIHSSRKIVPELLVTNYPTDIELEI